jgi:HEPN domain-containing protein
MDENKRALVHDWLRKAQRDLTVAKILAENSEAIWEASLYHCQQAAEKALKGFLVYWAQRANGRNRQVRDQRGSSKRERPPRRVLGLGA